MTTNHERPDLSATKPSETAIDQIPSGDEPGPEEQTIDLEEDQGSPPEGETTTLPPEINTPQRHWWRDGPKYWFSKLIVTEMVTAIIIGLLFFGATEQFENSRQEQAERFENKRQEQAERLENVRLVRNALTEEDERRYRQFSGLDLRETNLPFLDLQRANFSEADLEGADLRHSDLTQAVLTSNLRLADLTRANLTEAWLPEAHLHQANLTQTNLEGANLFIAELEGADLTEANLRKRTSV